MLVRQIADSKLAQFAYLIGCPRTAETIVIDPERDVDRHFDLVAGHKMRIVAALLIALITVTPAFGQGGHGGRGMMGDPAHAADMQVFHQLFEHRTEIERHVIAREDGIETVTESKNPEVTRLLQTHVAAMLARVKEGRPIHQRDPLFVELFKNADRIEARHVLTTGGVRVIETSKDAYVVKLLQTHAEVVSAFLANGMSEMMKNHPVPPR